MKRRGDSENEAEIGEEKAETRPIKKEKEVVVYSDLHCTISHRVVFFLKRNKRGVEPSGEIAFLCADGS